MHLIKKLTSMWLIMMKCFWYLYSCSQNNSLPGYLTSDTTRKFFCSKKSRKWCRIWSRGSSGVGEFPFHSDDLRFDLSPPNVPVAQ